ncbi:MAG: hypothetical protein CR997_10180 [Acidobacteria bacterium]|nr:MAG: hypothetical protein CR997_10180 [Acidobacteriota bacterium]
MKLIFRFSKWLHKYIGLLLIVFLIWMSISGILLNHPRWIASCSLPVSLIPTPYHIHNWSQGSLRDAVFDEAEGRIYFAGIRGIWKSDDQGRSFHPFTNGLSPDLFYQKTSDLHLDRASGVLLAATDGGLFMKPRFAESWQKIALNEADHAKVVRIQPIPDGFLVATNSQFFQSQQPEGPYEECVLSRPESGVGMIKLFFDLHDGKIWGLIGRLFFDLMALLIIFLSVSAFFIWFFPKLRKKWAAHLKKKLRKIYRFCFVYHLKWGFWFAIPILIIGVTGLFMRPPMLILLANRSLPRAFYPGPLPSNPWHHKIQNILYLEDAKQLLVEADGLWMGSLEKSEPFRQLDWDAPVFVMGTTVLEQTSADSFLMGSFSGLFDYTPETGQITDCMTALPAENISKMRIRGLRITGYFKTPDGEAFASTHRKGLLAVGQGETAVNRYPVPKLLGEQGRVPLWDFLFELHNGRIFSKWLGIWSKLVVPLGALLFVILSFTGIYDWCMLKIIKPRKRKAT